jgi:hypothetical protein
MPERQAIDPVFLWGAHAPPRAPFRALAEGSARIRAQAVLVIRRKILTRRVRTPALWSSHADTCMAIAGGQKPL